MRTTLTLDDDVAENAKQAAQQCHRPFKKIINQALRLGLVQIHKTSKPQHRYKTKSHFMGLKPGFSLDNVQELLSQLEGETRR